MNSITIATPGPWSYDAPVAGRVGIFADVTNPRTGEVTFGVVIGETNRIFDGEGVAAAPDLLAALRLVWNSIDRVNHPAAVAVSAAIAKAQGRE